METRSTFDILLVEDEEIVATVARRMLERDGHRIETAVDGVDAMQKLGERERFPDVILLDLEMPRMDGRETMARVLEENPAARIILTSGYAAESADSAEPGGNVRFLQKPYTRADLSAAIQEIGGGPTTPRG